MSLINKVILIIAGMFFLINVSCNNAASSLADVSNTPPTAPTNLTAGDITENGARLLWDQSSDSDGTVAGYNIYMSFTSGSDFTLLNDTAETEYSVNDLTPDTSYYIVVKAIDDKAAESDASNEIHFHTLSIVVDDTPPSAPGDLQITVFSSSRIDLSWDDNSDNEESFRIERASDAGGNPGTWYEIKITGVNATSYNDIMLSASTKYHYRIRAYNSAGYSDYTGTASATTTALPAGTFLADYTVAKESVLRGIPQTAIDNAKNTLRIVYFHTSHGSRVIDGMTGLKNYKTGDNTKWDFTIDGSIQAGKLSIEDHNATDGDLSTQETVTNGHTQWYHITKAYLDTPAKSHINVVMWSWCDPAGHDHHKYIEDMEALISEYPAKTFVFMTGHPNGDGENSSGTSAFHCHDVVSSHCQLNNRYVLDYWDIETHGMDDTYYPNANDNGVSGTNTFYQDWMNAHVLGTDYFNCSCQHADQPITGNRITYASWWLWARLAGWDGIAE